LQYFYTSPAWGKNFDAPTALASKFDGQNRKLFRVETFLKLNILFVRYYVRSRSRNALLPQNNAPPCGSGSATMVFDVKAKLNLFFYNFNFKKLV
jgi:hypothetical protein